MNMTDSFKHALNHLQLTVRLMNNHRATIAFDKQGTMGDLYPDAHFNIVLSDSMVYSAIAPLRDILDGCYDPVQAKPEMFTIVANGIVRKGEMLDFIREFRSAFAEASQYL